MSTHGSCNGCGKGFSFFKKEEACKNCGLSFCSKCVSIKVAIPKLNHAVHLVCLRCHAILTGKIKDTSQKRDISPPANFIRSMQPTQPAPAVSGDRKQSLKKKGVIEDPVVKRYLKPEYRNLSKDDMEIAERLEKLKEEHKVLELGPNPLPPIEDVEQRLAKLKGDAKPQADTGVIAAAHSTPAQPPAKPLTQHEETTNLLKQVTDEVSIDRKVSGQPAAPADAPAPAAANTNSEGLDNADLEEVQSLIAQAASELEIDAAKALGELKKDKEIMARLDQLKSRRISKGEGGDVPTSAEGAEASPQDEDSEDEEVQVKTILQQALEERRLDERLEAAGGFKPPLKKEKSVTVLPPDPDEIDPDELPWCCICNEDATIRCLDCDLDLYCRRCFADGHKQLYEDDHQHVPYKKPKTLDVR